jgi:hypothetical protein
MVSVNQIIRVVSVGCALSALLAEFVGVPYGATLFHCATGMLAGITTFDIVLLWGR